MIDVKKSQMPDRDRLMEYADEYRRIKAMQGEAWDELCEYAVTLAQVGYRKADVCRWAGISRPTLDAKIHELTEGTS